MFWSEIGSEFKEPGGTPPPRILRSQVYREEVLMDPRNKELRISPSSVEGGVTAQRLDSLLHRGPMF